MAGFSHPLGRISKGTRNIVLMAVSLILGFQIMLSFFHHKARQSFSRRYLEDPHSGPITRLYISTATGSGLIKTPELDQTLSDLQEFDRLLMDDPDPFSFDSIPPNPLTWLRLEHGNPTEYADLSLEKKADEYANKLLPETGYQFDAIHDIYDEDVYHRDYGIDKINAWAKLRDKLGHTVVEMMKLTDEKVSSLIYENMLRKMRHNEMLARYMRHVIYYLKIFSSLFLKDDDLLAGGKLMDDCKVASESLFPWFTGKFPVFTKYDSSLRPTEIYPMGTPSSGGCFVKSIQTQINGKGVVITADSKFVPSLAGLLSVLRVLGNTLPVQIVHSGELSKTSIKKLVLVATKEMNGEDGNQLVPLDVTFVDVSSAIKGEYMESFDSWGHKILAYMFNSYEDMILMDADTVPLIAPTKFFEFFQYKKSGTMFFRDREESGDRSTGGRTMLQDIINGPIEKQYLNMDKGDGNVLDNRFFARNMRHMMEAGLMLVNRKAKFDGVLASMTMQLLDPFKVLVLGDKEFMWLGQEYMGNHYRFNRNAAIAVGEISTHKKSSVEYHEICSTHPGHLGDDAKTLLWINSGFLVCKYPKACAKDVGKEEEYRGMDVNQLEAYYNSPFKIRAGIIPPAYTDKEFRVAKGEPVQGWKWTRRCRGYRWCAYDIIGGEEGMNSPSVARGKVVEFSENEIKEFDLLSQVWTEAFKNAES